MRPQNVMATAARKPQGVGQGPFPNARSARRPPANLSLSIRHHPLAKDAADRDNASSETPPSLQNNQGSSGESTNPEKWFTKSNEHVRRSKPVFDDNESPFEINDFEDSPMDFPGGPPILPSQGALNSHGSSSEEYRSVIDDLTVQNQKLKKRLRRFQNVRNPTLQADKLFEVRVHGLPASKKQELEALLARFAQNVNQSPNSGVSPGLQAVPSGSKKPSSSMSSHRFDDSGYGSMSVSNIPSSTSLGADRSMATQTEASQATANHIHSYLHDIPEGLLPRHPKAMTEKAKKRLIVRRLEQIFGGRDPTPGVHSQPLQQEEVSQSAAQADRSALEAEGGKASTEGIREAKIMQVETEDPMDICQKPKHSADKKQAVNEHDHIKPASPFHDQRPTRPLDLDPDRAQVPADNIEYIRHLGFSLPNMTDHRPVTDGQGWVYLNLLINMAQLHTINVTADFVKKAVSEYSTKFELAPDGRKIRWKGGSSNLSPQNSSNGMSGVDQSPTSSEDRPNKRPRPSHLESEESTSSSGYVNKRRHATPVRESKVAYKPVFPPKVFEDDSDADMADDSSEISSPLPADITGDSSGTKQSSSMSKRRDEGPIIFYNNATFYTDLSGFKPSTPPDLDTVANSPDNSYLLGTGPSTPPKPYGNIRTSSRPLFSLTRPSHDAMSVESALDMESSIDVSMPETSPKHVTFAEPDKPILFEASGLGGVIPKDNIAIKVTRQTSQISPGKAPTRKISTWPRSVLATSPARLRVAEKILNVQTVELPPSELPPAFMTFDDEDYDSDAESDVSDASIRAPSDSVSLPSTTGSATQQPYSRIRDPLSPLSTRPMPPESTYSTSLGDEEDSGGSGQDVDFLASARAVDPDAIRRKEREYDAEMAERLAEEIPAGSSAATVGGGSGFPSPNAEVEMEEQSRREERARRRRSQMQRGQEVDEDEESSEDEDEEDEYGAERSISS